MRPLLAYHIAKINITAIITQYRLTYLQSKMVYAEKADRLPSNAEALVVNGKHLLVFEL